jgi:indolepyruvate ferredoxin oxidoreductase, beta subunit
MRTCNVLLIGVGGQGLVTLGDLVARAAMDTDVPFSFVPSKGMAQRGGFVKVEIRLGRSLAGPRVAEGEADMVAAMERSEALKGLRFTRPDGCFVLYNDVWEPTGVMIGTDAYPTLSSIVRAIEKVGCELVVIDPAHRPRLEHRPAAANIIVLGALFAQPNLSELIPAGVMEDVLSDRWPKAAEANIEAFRYGIAAGRLSTGRSQVREPLTGGDSGVVG